ncbi:hypothetical protein Tco_0341152 [Tanacetum coccineum]
MNMTREILVGPAFNLLKGTYKSLTELEYHFKECSKSITERLDWHNPEGKQYPFDLRGDLSKRCSTSVTKTKAATYEIKWIEDLVPNLFVSNMSSSKDVYSRKGIIAVTRLTIMKKYEYGHLEEIEVRREDQQLYKFREGDFLRLHLQDIEDMLLLLVPQKLNNLTIDERYDLNVTLRMFTRRIVIQMRSDLRNMTAYTAYSDPQRDGLSAKEKIEWTRQVKGSGYDSGYRQAALSKKDDEESGEVLWWQGIRE